MGTKELIDRILEEARERAAAIRKEKEQQVLEIEERVREYETRLVAEQREQIKNRVETILKNSRSRAGLECQKIMLQAKWRVIDRVWKEAKEKIINSPDYGAILKRLAQRYAQPDSTVHLSEADKNRYGSELQVRLGEPVAIAGGMIIRTGREEIDLSLDSLLNSVQEELITELAQVLFPSG